MFQKNILIIGSGSIAIKHYDNLKKIGYHPLLYSKTRYEYIKSKDKYNIIRFLNFSKIKKKDFLFCVIANETHKHFYYLKILIKKGINIYCEKPVVHKLKEVNEIKRIIKKKKILFYSGYQIVNSQIFNSLKRLVNKRAIKSINLYVGYNIKYWRKQNLNGYYLKTNLGGGPIFELIHEINIINKFFVRITKIITLKKKSKIYKCEEVAVSIYETNKKIVGTLNQEICNENYKRKINILTDINEIEVDILKGSIKVFKKNKIVKYLKFGNLNQPKLIRKNYKLFINYIKLGKYNESKNLLLEALYDVQIAVKMHNDKKL